MVWPVMDRTYKVAQMFCKSVGCGVLVDNGYCSKHQTDKNRYQGSSTSRGYDRRWRNFRKRYLSENVLCIDCLEQQHIKLAEHIHHKRKLKDFPELKYEETNLMSLCEECHNTRTAQGE